MHVPNSVIRMNRFGQHAETIEKGFVIPASVAGQHEFLANSPKTLKDSRIGLLKIFQTIGNIKVNGGNGALLTRFSN